MRCTHPEEISQASQAIKLFLLLPCVSSGTKRGAATAKKKSSRFWSVQAQLSQAVGKSIELHNENAGTSTQAALPTCLDGLNTLLLVSTVQPKQYIALASPIQKKASGMINLCVNSLPEEVEAAVNGRIE